MVCKLLRWLISLSIIFLRSIQVAARIHTPCSFIDEWYSILWLYPVGLTIYWLQDIQFFFPAWIYYEQCCYSHSFTYFSMNMNFHFFGIKAQECNCLDIWLNVSLFCKRLPNCFQKRLYNFIFLLSMYEGNSFSAEFHVTCVLILTILIGVF